MSLLLGIGKILGSVVLVALFIAGVFKANPRTHDPELKPFAEYAVGFVCCFISVVSFYYLWF